ncbi:inositol metabolism protein Opi10 [Protomyces lactucae-debilis]|uniref:Inositol metabolism protein Opi10 n=1 Tax=Protomyces lactucae-debilis TaxID=2754530 RepID=A0A1Y2FNP9_PROLT|nr:inositol metabolism protein Opi10 [Protomyces lactucae-debilis]ORY85621.1 inositol metabolism protein Opi10 [Protomyces lactucae-debilis]
MFGAICAGRPVQTNLVQVDQNKFVFSLPDAASINHITVFLLPEQPFPEGYAATVFFSWPGKDFQLLGGLSNAKPSAIFKVKQQPNTSGLQQGPVEAALGISIEPIQAVESQVTAMKQAAVAGQTSTAVAVAPPNAAVLTGRVVRNLYNFLSGYTVDANQLNANEQFVPLRAFQEWHSKFMSRIQKDASFLEQDQE